jgi:hypothetical protein
MGKSSTFDNDLLKLIFNGTAIANLADNAASTPLTNLYLSLHTANPGAGGNQTTFECTYTSYARVAVARTSGGWVVTGSSVSPASTISLPTATGGTEIATHAAIGTASSGTGKILYSGAITPNIAINSGVTPTLPTSSTISEA